MAELGRPRPRPLVEPAALLVQGAAWAPLASANPRAAPQKRRVSVVCMENGVTSLSVPSTYTAGSHWLERGKAQQVPRGEACALALSGSDRGGGWAEGGGLPGVLATGPGREASPRQRPQCTHMKSCLVPSNPYM